MRRASRPRANFFRLCRAWEWERGNADVLNAVEQYFRRFGWCEKQISAEPQRELGIVIVVPCYNEPDLIGALESLWRCERPQSAVEVIAVVNGAADAPEGVRERNRLTFEEAKAWEAEHVDLGMIFHVLKFAELPPKHAGVGLARKIGMDEALRRFDVVGRFGIIVGFDADCRCDVNYLQALENHFEEHPESPGCSIYFEHPLEEAKAPAIREAVAEYELHLRYYVQALRHAKFPYAFHTVGSAMAVRAEVYMEQGGMNKRKGGEDFYFLQKVIALGGFTDLTSTRVLPAPRESDRVPFGTGRAVMDYLAGKAKQTYPIEAFVDLKAFLDAIPGFSGELPKAMAEFLAEEQFDEALQEIRANTTNAAAFRKRVLRWFDGFRAMKFLHYARDNFYGARAVASEAAKLLGEAGPSIELLKKYRALDRLPNAQTARIEK